jgi:hypothetical protein
MDVCIATDVAGNFYIGYTSTTIRIQKLDDSRTLLWSITIDNTDGWARPYLAVDSSGAVYFTYEATGGGGGDREVCVAKIAADGSEFLWNRSYGVIGDDHCPKMAIDGSDNVILVFATTGQIAGGTPTGGSDVAVFKLNPAGDVLWSLQHPTLNTPGEDTEPVVAVAPTGALIVSYKTTSASGETVNVTSTLTTAGSVAWTRQYPDLGYVPCFLAGTPVRTRRGTIPIEAIVVGDEVRTGRGSWAAVQRIRVTPTVGSEKTLPYIVPDGWTAGRGGAECQFYISPSHCVAVPGVGMVRAAELGLDRASHLRVGETFLYYNLEVEDWENIIVCGVEVESLAPRRVAQMTAAQYSQMVCRQYRIAEEIPFAKLLQNVTPLPDGTLRVFLMPNSATANRSAISQALAYSRVHSRAFSSYAARFVR